MCAACMGGVVMPVKHFIIIDACFLDTENLCYERIRHPDHILPCAHIFHTRKAANARVRDLEKLLQYPKGKGYLKVVQITVPKGEL